MSCGTAYLYLFTPGAIYGHWAITVGSKSCGTAYLQAFTPDAIYGHE